MSYYDEHDYEPDDDYYDEPMPQSWIRYTGTTQPNGVIVVHVETNDNYDRGYPTEYADWRETYKDVSDFLKAVHGGSGWGISMRRIVTLDGDEVVNNKRKRLVTQWEPLV